MEESAAIIFKPKHPTFVAEVEGVDFSKPISDSVIEQLQKGIDTYGVLIFRKANIDNATQVAFSRRFGELDSMPFIRRRGRFPDQPHIFDISNMDDNGQILKTTNRVQALLTKGNELWHADMQYHPRRDKYSVLHGVQLPPKGLGGGD